MLGYFAAFISIFIWGITFVSTKVLLIDFSPMEILFLRYIIAYVSLWILYPRTIKLTPKENISVAKQEIYFAFAGLTGVFLYQLLENIAINISTASNVSIIVATAPIFTGLGVHLFLKHELKKLTPFFFLGFICAIIGIAFVSFNGTVVLKLNPLGDGLALISAIMWAIYSIIMSKINSLGYPTLGATRKIFGYSILLMIPVSFFLGMDYSPEVNIARFSKPMNWINLIFLGVGASALCFSAWAKALKILGVVKTSVYIYLIPVITLFFAAIILHEKITLMALIGTGLTILGLLLSEKK